MENTADSQPKTLLIVDDAPENITILKGVLGNLYRIRPAIHGRAALRAALVEPIPDLILLDVMMPEMDGYEVCRQLRADPRTREIPVIFVTGLSDDADEILGLELGAVDYITKPVRPAIVRARVKTQLALREAVQTIEAQNAWLREEREMIESIVLRMREADSFVMDRVRHLYHPVEQTSGDLLLSGMTPDGRRIVLLGDFTGHGLKAAIGGPLVYYIFQSLLARGESGASLFREINNQLHVRLPVDTFLAATLVEVDATRGSVMILNAAMPECYILRDGVLMRRIHSRFTPLGVTRMADPPVMEEPLRLISGDRICLHTDGIVEAAAPGGERFGGERLLAFLEEVTARGGALEDLLPLLRGFGAREVFEDDIALIEVTV
ncbi:Protein-glutamate methylesterase/protein-glutamine glutaminase [Candidatus Magnetaquicoccaceae bacterium FCR-1]|uniref:Protein-glutamate methylesterase/protein-glutamine glutaminase n=1 Tax=Candidatus Magnetaquiglobus chichijimensis TaxID=3141448 RepID=A0ABQ0C7P2_9PROT